MSDIANADARRRVRSVADTTLFDYGPARARLLVRLWRALARGVPLPPEELASLAADAGVDTADALEFAESVCEHDANGRIVGVLGLSLGQHPHRFTVDGRSFTTWCAIDTLFLPAMLGISAAIESESPVSDRPIRLTVTPGGVRDLSPPGAAVSLPLVDPEAIDISSARGLRGAFCQRIHFFATPGEAKEWIGGQGAEFEILSVPEAWEHAMAAWSKMLPHVRALDRQHR